jgi:hypothetical protein
LLRPSRIASIREEVSGVPTTGVGGDCHLKLRIKREIRITRKIIPKKRCFFS